MTASGTLLQMVSSLAPPMQSECWMHLLTWNYLAQATLMFESTQEPLLTLLMLCSMIAQPHFETLLCVLRRRYQ